MAVSFPEQPKLVNSSEKYVYEKLMTLSDSWHVYANMQQHILLYERISRGEIDFILTHPYFGIVLIEVKGHGVVCKDGTWFRGDKKTKDPYTQIEDARGNLNQFLFQNIEELKPIIKEEKDMRKISSSIHTLVVFPFLPDFQNLGMKASKSNTLTQTDLDDLSDYFKENIPQKDFGSLKGIQEKFKDVVLPNVNTAPLRGLTKNLMDQMMASTEEQKIILNAIIDNNSHVAIKGPAGSGKTVLAVEAARQAAEKGEKVLFLCYNQNLSRFLSDLLSDNPLIEVYSLFGLFAKININLKDVGTSNLTPSDAAPIIADIMNDNFDKFDTSFDVLIIDEAQDYSSLFWPTFDLLTENKKWFLFYDTRQAITHSDWNLPELSKQSWTTFPLTKYLRSTKEISQQVLKVYDDEYNASAISGLEPQYIQLKNKGWEEGLAALVQILTGLFETEKYHASQVQILIPHSRYLEEVEQTSYKPNLKIGAIKEIQIESIHKFKGLESEVVVMILPSIESLESETTTDIRSLIYVGMSRATSLLILIGDQEVKALANWSP
tara:strand:- start:8734 stop:10380 length:1647 start_codon:yes stop_codon:yes gene_type:complete